MTDSGTRGSMCYYGYRSHGGRVSEVIFTERELDVMNVLWDLGTGTVADVREGIRDDLAYTTVLTILRTLEEKGYVGHEEEGRAYRYHPLVERDRAQTSALRRMTRKLFDGSTEMLVTRLVSDRDLDDDEIRRLQELLSERLDRRS